MSGMKCSVPQPALSEQVNSGNRVVQMGLHEGSVHGKENLPQSAVHTLPEAPQDTTGLLGCKGTLLARG